MSDSPLIIENGKGVLYNMTGYLSGPMDFAKDDGIGWRKQLRKLCTEKNLGIKFYDPTDKPENLGVEIKDKKEHIQRLKKRGRWKEIREWAKGIRRIDLRMVDASDFVIIYVDVNVHMCGSYDEAITAERQRKPVLAIIEGGKETAPSWFFGIVHYTEMFDSVDKLVDHLEKLNSGKKFMDNRWVMLRD